MNQFVAEWNAWRDSRNSSLAKPFGWLSVVGLHWLDEESTWDGAPGTFSVEDGWAHVALDPDAKAGPAAATFDLLRGNDAAYPSTPDPSAEVAAESPSDPSAEAVAEPTANSAEVAAEPASSVQVRLEQSGFAAKLQAGGSLEWFTVGHVLYELIERGGRLGVRVRDSKSPLLAKFIETPVFEPTRDFVYLGRFTPFDEPVERTIGSAQKDLQLTAWLVGTVTFDSESGPVTLLAGGCPQAGLTLTFRDETNGKTTSAWRTLDLGIPNHDGSLVVDFNRAINFPCAFTAFATCPAPVEENTVPFLVRAGEQRSPFYLSREGINSPFLFFKFWDREDPDQTADNYSRFGLDTTYVNPLTDEDYPSLVGYDGVALSGGDLSQMSRRTRSRLISTVTEALTSRIPVIGIGEYARLVVTAERELREYQGADAEIVRPHQASRAEVSARAAAPSVSAGSGLPASGQGLSADGPTGSAPAGVSIVFNKELDPVRGGFDVVGGTDDDLVHVQMPAGLPLESEYDEVSDYEAALKARTPIRSWQEFTFRIARLVRTHR